MALILAIEPDRRQASRVAAIVKNRLHAEIVQADTTEHAVEALAGRVPDLILTSLLLSRKDDAALADWLRESDEAGAACPDARHPGAERRLTRRRRGRRPAVAFHARHGRGTTRPPTAAIPRSLPRRSVNIWNAPLKSARLAARRLEDMKDGRRGGSRRRSRGRRTGQPTRLHRMTAAVDCYRPSADAADNPEPALLRGRSRRADRCGARRRPDRVAGIRALRRRRCLVGDRPGRRRTDRAVETLEPPAYSLEEEDDAAASSSPLNRSICSASSRSCRTSQSAIEDAAAAPRARATMSSPSSRKRSTMTPTNRIVPTPTPRLTAKC